MRPRSDLADTRHGAPYETRIAVMATSTFAVLIVALVLVSITVVVAVRLRGASLVDFHLAPAERVLFEAHGLTLRLGFRDDLVIRDAFVRVTHRRVLLGTGSLSTPHRARVQLVGLLDDYGFGKGVIDDGYTTFPLQRRHVAIEGNIVTLRPLGAGFEVPSRIDIVFDESTRAQKLRAALVVPLALRSAVRADSSRVRRVPTE